MSFCNLNQGKGFFSLTVFSHFTRDTSLYSGGEKKKERENKMYM